MSKLHFDYWMNLLFTENAAETHYTIKCLPKDTDVQKISDVNITIFPENSFQKGEDSFGNLTIYGSVRTVHHTFGFHISGDAETNCSDGETVREDEYTGIYLYPYGLNKAGDNIRDYFSKLVLDSDVNDSRRSNYEKAWMLMKCLHEEFHYETGSTTMRTTAEEAFMQRKGVCQDYAHIMITLCRILGIPARYVNGLMIGEGYSHAWVELYTGEGWYGLDPTNNLHVDDYYIKFAHGRDYTDCILDKGLFRGITNQTQEIYVNVEEI